MYKPADSHKYRPNTKKLYEEHYGVVIPDGYEVHHILPERLGGTHDISNLTVLYQDDHALAHLELYERLGDYRDLCAYHMISGRDHEAHLVACAMGGKASQIAKKERGDLNGFQLFDQEKRKAVAAKAGRIGGTKQRDLGIGIHVDADTRLSWSKMGGYASIESNGFLDSSRQSERGKKGGVKNKGAKWYNDGNRLYKYTAAQQLTESFDDFIERTNMKKGRIK